MPFFYGYEFQTFYKYLFAKILTINKNIFRVFNQSNPFLRFHAITARRRILVNCLDIGK